MARVDAMAPDGACEQMYITADVSPQQLRVEHADRRIARAFRDRFPNAARLLRRGGVVALDLSCIVRITALQRDEYVVVEWNLVALEHVGISLGDAKHAVAETDPAHERIGRMVPT